MSVINVKTHGATGDGATDDYAAVMAAIQEAIDGGGGTVFFPAGEYALSLYPLLSHWFPEIARSSTNCASTA